MTQTSTDRTTARYARKAASYSEIVHIVNNGVALCNPKFVLDLGTFGYDYVSRSPYLSICLRCEKKAATVPEASEATMTCPRNCGVPVWLHNSSDLVDGRCDTAPRTPVVVANVGGTVHVHKVGCADLRRAYLPTDLETVEVTSRKNLVTSIYGGFEDLAEDGANWEAFAANEGLRFFPCVTI